MDKKTQRLRSVQLDRVRMICGEEGKGPPLLLIHGLPGPFVWRRALPHLGAHFRCIFPHVLGMGDSRSDEPGDYVLSRQAEWILQLMDALDIQRAHLLGHDLGAVIAAAAASAHPERLGKLILCLAPPGKPWRHPFLERAGAWGRFPGGFALFAALLRIRWFARSRKGWGASLADPDAIGPEDLPAWSRFLNRSTPLRPGALLRIWNPSVVQGCAGMLAGYQGPTMLLWGCDYPLLSPSWAIELYHAIPGAIRFELIPFTGLFPQWESPEAFSRIVVDFLLARATRRPGGRAPAAPAGNDRVQPATP